MRPIVATITALIVLGSPSSAQYGLGTNPTPVPAVSAEDTAKMRVLYGYRWFMLVRRCNEVRQGYLLQYVNDDEFARANATIKAIVQQAKTNFPGLD